MDLGTIPVIIDPESSDFEKQCEEAAEIIKDMILERLNNSGN